MFEPVLQKLEPFAREFSRRGKHLYLVGGAVRNLVLGRAVHDYDFATDALPEEVQTYFPKVLPTGLQHGTVTVLYHGTPYEVTTFRVDGEYSDGRRPDGVVFTRNLEEDLKRRDFTINAMALNLADGSLSDPHGGGVDLKRKVLRAIGEPGQRFDEDALRLLRLYRFASQLGFSIDLATEAAVGSRREKLLSVSRERIREELAKTMAGEFPARSWAALARLGFLELLFPLLSPEPLSDRAFATLDTIGPDVRWPFWLTLASGDKRALWESSLKHLTFSNADQAAILGPARALDYLAGGEGSSVTAKRITEAWGSRNRTALGVDYLVALETEGYWSDKRNLKEELLRVADSEEPVFLSELAIGGKELLAAGIPGGPQIGGVLKKLQQVVWADPTKNTRDELITWAKSLL